MRMGEANPRSEAPGGEFEPRRSETDVQTDAAGSDSGSAAAFAVVNGRACARSEVAVTATTPLWSWPHGCGG